MPRAAVVVELDTLILEEKLSRLQRRLGLARISLAQAEDFDRALIDPDFGEYVSEHQTLRKAIELAESTRDLRDWYLRSTLGFYGIGTRPLEDLRKAEAEFAKAVAALTQAGEVLRRKTLENQLDRRKIETRITRIEADVVNVKVEIEMSRMVAPISGAIELHVAEGIFVEEKDPLFTVKLR